MRIRSCVLYYLVLCPKCRAFLDGYVVSSGLGPARVRCRKCAAVYASSRREWNDSGTLGRTRFVVVSVVHACALGFLGGITGSLAAYGWEHGFTSTVPRSAFFGVSFFVAAACYALVTATLQLARVARSKARARERAREPVVARLSSLDLGLQFKMLVLVWVPVLLCDAIGSMS